MHEDLIFDASAGIGSQPDILIRFKSCYPFDETDGSDGNKIILVSGLGIVFFDNMRHQAQVVFNELVSGLQVAFRILGQISSLLLCLQRLWK